MHGISEIVSSNFKHILPLPSRECDLELSTHQLLIPGRICSPNGYITLSAKDHMVNLGKRKATNVDSLIIINNPNWKNSGRKPPASQVNWSASLGKRQNRAAKVSLDDLVIDSNPNWTTSGQKLSVPMLMQTSKSASSSFPVNQTVPCPSDPVQSPNPVPMKRPKLNRAFSNLMKQSWFRFLFFNVSTLHRWLPPLIHPCMVATTGEELSEYPA